MPNAKAHGTRERWPWRGAVLAWHLARLASTAAGAAAAVALTYAAARATAARRPALAGAAAGGRAAGAQPAVRLHVRAGDERRAAGRAGALVLWLAVRGGPTVRRAAAMGLALRPGADHEAERAAAGAGGGSSGRRAWASGEGDRGTSPRAPSARAAEALARVAALAGAAAAVSGWWYLRNWRLPGGFLPLGWACSAPSS